MENIMICRCEEVYLKQIKDAQKNGLKTAQEIKMATRLGMGYCQGRMCRTLIERFLQVEDIYQDQQPSSLTIHKPVRPVSLENIAKLGEE